MHHSCHSDMKQCNERILLYFMQHNDDWHIVGRSQSWLCGPTQSCKARTPGYHDPRIATHHVWTHCRTLQHSALNSSAASLCPTETHCSILLFTIDMFTHLIQRYYKDAQAWMEKKTPLDGQSAHSCSCTCLCVWPTLSWWPFNACILWAVKCCTTSKPN